jgi:uncharacterized protein YvpB
MRKLRALSLIMIAAVACALGAPAVTAQSSPVTVWAEFASTNASPGCVIEVSLDGGAGLAGVSYSLITSDDSSGAVVSTDSGTANDSGIAWLAIDTSGAGSSAKLWTSVVVNDSYIGGKTIWVGADGSCSGNGELVTFSGSASTSSSSSSSSDADTGANDGAVIIPGAIAYHQQRGLSCEYASLAIATGMLGDWVSEYDFESVVPLNDNPHWGYRGDITGSWGNTTNYGVYATPLVPALNAFGFQGEIFYGGRDTLKAQIDMGRPTLVWIGARGETGSFDEYAADGTRYQLTPYMHVVVIYGYDAGGVYVSDPGNGSLTHWSWDSFEAMWYEVDGMALAVHW